MSWLVDAWTLNRDFLETGGWVLVPIGLVTCLMWTMILERYWYLRTAHRVVVRETLEKWWERPDRASWHAHQIRRAMISRVSSAASRTVSIIGTLVRMCPLLGLLGTVTGMIEVFDAMAVSGNGNARAMASGVSRATIPTMAGMVAALSGVILSHQLDRRTKNEADIVAEQLVFGDDDRAAAKAE